MPEKVVILTTVDNPYDYFKEYEKWFKFDCIEHDYNCESILGREVIFTDDMTENEKLEEIERAIDNIISLDPFNIYKKVVTTE